MNRQPRFPEEFKIEAVKQVTEIWYGWRGAGHTDAFDLPLSLNATTSITSITSMLNPTAR